MDSDSDLGVPSNSEIFDSSLEEQVDSHDNSPHKSVINKLTTKTIAKTFRKVPSSKSTQSYRE